MVAHVLQPDKLPHGDAMLDIGAFAQLLRVPMVELHVFIDEALLWVRLQLHRAPLDGAHDGMHIEVYTA